MYNLGDMGASFNAERISSNVRIPNIPKINATLDLVLKSASEEEGDRSGKRYDFVFEVTNSDVDQIFGGGTYVEKFYHGASKVDREKCWKKLTPLLVALAGGVMQDPKAVAVAPDTLGDCLAATAAAKAANQKPALDLKVRLVRVMEDARPDKDTGKIDPKYLEKDGVTPVKFARDTYVVV